MLKCDFHIHTGSDVKDNLDYSDKQLIDKAAGLGFDAISITNHGTCAYNEGLRQYAEGKGVFLISGSEAYVEGKHVILLNISQEDIDNVSTFNDLRELKKRKEIIAIAAHPYFILPSCLGKKLEENIDVFDAIEYSFFYTRFFNRNRKAQHIAKKYSKPMILGSDSHLLKRFGESYSLLDAKKDFKSIKEGILANRIKIVSRELGFFDFIKKIFLILIRKNI